MNICVQGFVFTQVFISLHLGIELLDQILTLFNHEELPDCFPKQLNRLAFPPAMYEGSNFSAPSPALLIICLSTSSHPSERKRHLIVVLICIALMPRDAGYLFRGLFLMTVVIRESIILEEEFSRYKGSGTQKHDSLCAIISFRPQNHNKSLFLPTKPSILEY